MIVLCVADLAAQNRSDYRFRSRMADSLVMRIDTFSVVPGTFVVQGLEASDYQLDYTNAILRLTDSSLIGRPILCKYKVFPMDLSKPVAHKSTDMILPRFVRDPSARDLVPLSFPSDDRLFDSDLQGNGSVSRSVSVGNNQNFVLDAGMNLQLSGHIAPDVEIVANITDENLPVQPEGNTRYIKDFNKVFLQLKYKEQLKVTAGDIEVLPMGETYFYKLVRQYTGLSIQVNSVFDSVNRMSNVVGGGISKGKFVRNQITPIHGVQGPYKLYGSQGETNIVVLSGTEKVFLDGVLMTRGQDNDYVIDYNVGEVTFTAKHLIASTNRIVITFEYTDRYYSRYNLFTDNEFQHEKLNKLTLGVHFFHEQDLKNRSIQPELTDDQMRFLASAGDVSSASMASALLANDYTLSEILYHQKDTVVNGTVYSPVYVYAGSNRDQVFRVPFSYVGANKGNYILSQSVANGKVYQWVAPVNGIPQGDYEPVVQLNTPKMNELMAVNATYAVSDKLTAMTELAFSYTDNNLFSKSGDRDNAGIAYKLKLDYQTGLGRRVYDSLWRYNVGIDYEFVHKNYTPLKSFRPVEYYREYNLESDYTSTASEQLAGVATGFSHPQKGSTRYSFNWLARFGELSAFRHELNSRHTFNSWQWSSVSSHLASNQQIQKSQFVKTVNDFSKSFSKVKLGLKEYLEYNAFRSTATDSLRLNSYAFNEAALYLANSDSVTGYNYLFQIKNRVDDEAFDNVLSVRSLSNEAQVAFEVMKWRHNRLKGTMTYRNDRVRDTLRNFFSEHNFVANVDYSGNFWKGAVSLGVYYEAGSGLEQKREYTFLKVAAGQGSHIWNDYNGNGIEELDEFELAVFQNEADYVKVWLSTNEYVNTYNCGTTQVLQLRPANVWRNKKGFLKALSMFGNSTMLRTYQKCATRNDFRSLNPYWFEIPDSVLVSRSLNFKNNFSFALPSPYFSMDYIAMVNQSGSVLYYGLENMNLRHQELVFRSEIAKILILKSLYKYSVKENRVEGFSGRDYQIAAHHLQQSVTLNFDFGLSLSMTGEVGYKRNQLLGETANRYKGEFDATYRMKQRGAVDLRLQYINILYEGSVDGSVAYEMLDGLTAGHNFLWNITYQTHIFEYLQLNLQYEGRVTDNRKLIHTGFLQLKAFF